MFISDSINFSEWVAGSVGSNLSRSVVSPPYVDLVGPLPLSSAARSLPSSRCSLLLLLQTRLSYLESQHLFCRQFKHRKWGILLLLWPRIYDYLMKREMVHFHIHINERASALRRICSANLFFLFYCKIRTSMCMFEIHPR